jgi:putative hydrolase of the HAD superfamily
MSKNLIKGLIFDLGGVVVEWSNSKTYSYIEEIYGIPANDFKLIAEKSLPDAQTGKISETDWMRETFSHFGPPPPGFDKVWGKTFEAARYSPKLLKLLNKLRTAGYRIAALSNLEPSRAKWLREHGVDTLFNAVIFSCEVGLRKPDISKGSSDDLQIYKLTLSRLEFGAKKCLFIDDNINCVKAAESLGIRSILFENAEQLGMELHNRGVVFEKIT